MSSQVSQVSLDDFEGRTGGILVTDVRHRHCWISSKRRFVVITSIITSKNFQIATNDDIYVPKSEVMIQKASGLTNLWYQEGRRQGFATLA